MAISPSAAPPRRARVLFFLKGMAGLLLHPALFVMSFIAKAARGQGRNRSFAAVQTAFG
jgi:hypothetical protein